MKKTVQIVTIPLDKKGFSINDLIKKPAFDAAGEIERWKISYYGMSTGIWKAHQLLVLSDDEIKINDMYYASGSKTLEYSVFKADTARLVKIGNELGVKKVIASYPQIEGTLAISKETVQAWIDSGTPGKGSLEMEEHPMNKATFAQNMYQLKLTPNNEVVIVDELFEKQKELFIKAATSMTGSAILTPEFKALGEFATKLDSVDQELEDASKKSAPGSPYGQFHFKAGANWQKQQSATDAIRFSRWISDNGYFAYTDNKWVHVPAGSKYSDQEVRNMITDKELYEIWQQSK